MFNFLRVGITHGFLCRWTLHCLAWWTLLPELCWKGNRLANKVYIQYAYAYQVEGTTLITTDYRRNSEEFYVSMYCCTKRSLGNWYFVHERIGTTLFEVIPVCMLFSMSWVHRSSHLFPFLPYTKDDAKNMNAFDGQGTSEEIERLTSVWVIYILFMLL